MTPRPADTDQARTPSEIHNWLAVPGQSSARPEATHDLVVTVGEDVSATQKSAASADRAASSTLALVKVPAQPYDYPAATHNLLAAVGGYVSALAVRDALTTTPQGDPA